MLQNIIFIIVLFICFSPIAGEKQINKKDNIDNNKKDLNDRILIEKSNHRENISNVNGNNNSEILFQEDVINNEMDITKNSEASKQSNEKKTRNFTSIYDDAHIDSEKY